MSYFLFLSILLFLFWFLFLFLSRATRKEQLIMSLVGLVLSPAILLVSLESVWVANGSVTGIGIEDFLFSFSFFGIAAVIYQAILGKHMKPWKGKRSIFIHPVAHWFFHLIVVLAVWIILSLSFVLLLSLSSLHAFAIGGLLIGTYVIAHRHDLFFNAIVSGVMVMILLFILEQIFFFRLSGGDVAATETILSSVPTEELVWSWVVGFAIGPLYEYLRHQKLV